ncbi:MAG TPA: TOBE domain-containing protein, partial [Coleofasciculaceae cyanobacterium]
ITTIYVTHDQVEAMTLADQIVVLNRGRIQQIGEPQAIYAKPANRMVATFLGNPPMNVFQTTYTAQAFQISGQSLPCPDALQRRMQLSEGQTVELGIRPEHIEIAGLTNPIDTNKGQLMIEVNVVEPLGRETLIRGSLLNSDTLVDVQAPGNWRGHPGDHIGVQLDLDQLFVFDSTTGDALYP